MGFASAAMAQEARYGFVWEGANGYRMTGSMSFDKALIGTRLINESDMICFAIQGFKDGEPIGSWSLGMLNELTSWRLHFDPVAVAFVVDGFGIPMPQAWNMNGAGTDCGMGGFGFNLGNLGQDFCTDNQVIAESRVAPAKPFPAWRDDTISFPVGACTGPDLLSLLSN
ncbi:hypothetical protein [Thalassococcus lentus]|uniref:Uncharacterized protein n=1 Tax=Thalassococcus lentus TaxID=1210524 RepID=A0ABT4XWC2_9RHOB|nr:hypothetical protein [Thalassococcus lentus]MDA7426247.1 hypothetical protein [Thalassococcus lentus]